MSKIIRIKSISVQSLLSIIAIMYLIFFIAIMADIFKSANTMFLLIQIVFVPLFSILVLFLFYDLFGTRHTSFLLTIYDDLVQRIFFIYFGLYSILLLILCLSLKTIYEDFNVLVGFSLLLSQILFFSSIFLFLFMIISDISITISLMALYLSIELATFGANRLLYHAFYFNLHTPMSFSTVINIFIINLTLGLISFRLCKSIVTFN